MGTQPIFITRREVVAAYGFGSFFRGEAHDDIDLLIVLECDRDQILGAYNSLRGQVADLGQVMNVTFDLTVLTAKEFAERPLRNMNELVLLYTAKAEQVHLQD